MLGNFYSLPLSDKSNWIIDGQVGQVQTGSLVILWEIKQIIELIKVINVQFVAFHQNSQYEVRRHTSTNEGGPHKLKRKCRSGQINNLEHSCKEEKQWAAHCKATEEN